MKKLLLILFLLSISFSSYASVDGVYSCNISLSGQNMSSYISVNTNAAQQTLFVVAAVRPSTSFYGYGIGAIVGNIFSGQTNLLQPFSFTIGNDTVSGTVNTIWNGTVVTASGDCSKIW